MFNNGLYEFSIIFGKRIFKLSLKSGILILVFLGEIALGVYSFMFSESLLARFGFFVFTCFLVALLVLKFAGARIPENKKTSASLSENDIPEQI